MKVDDPIILFFLQVWVWKYVKTIFNFVFKGGFFFCEIFMLKYFRTQIPPNENLVPRFQRFIWIFPRCFPLEYCSIFKGHYRSHKLVAWWMGRRIPSLVTLSFLVLIKIRCTDLSLGECWTEVINVVGLLWNQTLY